MNRFMVLLLLAACAVMCRAEIWLHIDLKNSRSVDLEWIDDMSLDFSGDHLIVNGHYAIFDIQEIAGFNYIEKEDFYVGMDVVAVADKEVVGIYGADGCQVRRNGKVENLTSGVYIIRFDDGKTMKIKLP